MPDTIIHNDTDIDVKSLETLLLNNIEIKNNVKIINDNLDNILNIIIDENLTYMKNLNIIQKYNINKI